MELNIRNKCVLVTGAGRGLGNSISQCLARDGARIVGCSRTQSDLDELMKQIARTGSGHSCIALDLEKRDAPPKLLNYLREQQISPDIVVHNVGGNLGIIDPFCNLEDWRRVMRINVEIAIELNRTLVPDMQKRKWGRVCHVSSVSALENQGPPAYCAAKAALVAYTRSFGRYVSPDNVIVTSIMPGAIYTEGGYWDAASKERPEHVQKYLEERMAIQRFGKPDEIGNVVAFLCSDLASFCVGSSLLVDGGQGRVFYAQE